MYLARLVLNPFSREVQRDLRNPHDLHRTLLSLFPETDAGGARATFGLLHRIDVHPITGSVVLNVQSRTPVDWSRLPHGYLAAVPENPLVKEVGHIYSRIRAGQVFGFRLRANPTRSEGVGKKGAPRGRRIPVRGAEEQLEWLKGKAEQYGFELLASSTDPRSLDVVVVPERKLAFRKGRNGPMVTLQSVNFRGRLRVTDADRFRAALADGIGRGRAYGFGLLQLAPAKLTIRLR